MSCTHEGPLEAEQAKHTVAGGRHNISEHRLKLEVFGEYSSRSCICCWLCESFSRGAKGGSPCRSEEILRYVALVRPKERKSSVVDRVQ
jgi:hypothetical protein